MTNGDAEPPHQVVAVDGAIPVEARMAKATRYSTLSTVSAANVPRPH